MKDTLFGSKGTPSDVKGTPLICFSGSLVSSKCVLQFKYRLDMDIFQVSFGLAEAVFFLVSFKLETIKGHFRIQMRECLSYILEAGPQRAGPGQHHLGHRQAGGCRGEQRR